MNLRLRKMRRSKRHLKWLRRIFSLCYEGDLEELFGEEAGDEDLIDYVVDYYAAGLYPEIFEHFE